MFETIVFPGICYEINKNLALEALYVKFINTYFLTFLINYK